MTVLPVRGLVCGLQEGRQDREGEEGGRGEAHSGCSYSRDMEREVVFHFF